MQKEIKEFAHYKGECNNKNFHLNNQLQLLKIELEKHGYDEELDQVGKFKMNRKFSSRLVSKLKY